MQRSMIVLALVALCGARSYRRRGWPLSTRRRLRRTARSTRRTRTRMRRRDRRSQEACDLPPQRHRPRRSRRRPPRATASAPKPAAKDTAKKRPSPPATATFNREVFSYDGSGRRDPFLSLLSTGELRPAFNDLKLVAVAYDPTGRIGSGDAGRLDEGPVPREGRPDARTDARCADPSEVGDLHDRRIRLFSARTF